MSKGSRSDRPTPPPGAEELSARLQLLESKLHAAKVAYLNRATFEGEEMTYDGLVAVATDYMQTSYALQKSKFGSIKVRLSIAKLLR